MSEETFKAIVFGYESVIDSANECLAGLMSIDLNKASSGTKMRLNAKLKELNEQITKVQTKINE